MSLLEDIFLHDEANEARELERVIEGDEFDERPRSRSPSEEESDGGRREDEAEEDKRRVDPSTSNKTKRVTKNPRFLLNPARLTGPRGIQVIPDHFKDFKFKGKGHEKEDLDIVLKKLEHWAYRLYPKFQFQDCLKKIETLGKKRPVMVHLHKIRTDQFLSEETVVQKDSSDDEAQPPQEEDEFDKLLQQQIEIARATPAPGSVKKVVDKSDLWAKVMETPNRDDRSRLPMPKATSSPSISDEQKERMIRNRRLAEERRLARLKQATNMDNSTPNTIIEIDEAESLKERPNVNSETSNVIEINDELPPKKNNRSQVINSSDSEDECNVVAVNESIVVDVHNGSNVDKSVDDKIVDKKIEVDNDRDIEEMTVDIVQDRSKTNNSDDKIEEIDDNVVDRDGEGVDSLVDKDDHSQIGDNIVDQTRKDVDDEIVVEKGTHKVIEGLNIENVIDSNSVDKVQESEKITTEVTNGSSKLVNNDKVQSKDNDAGEFSEDIMDVDFNDEF